MSKILIPSNGPEDWRRLLAKPDLHWKIGRSARAMANAWEEAGDLPNEIAHLFKDHPDFLDEQPELLVAMPEWKVPLPGGVRESQSDVFALIRCGTRTLAVAVEGKVDETLGPTVEEWLVGASDGKQERLSFLCGHLNLMIEKVLPLRYQLFHRTVSAIIECERFGMDYAAMVIHSFSQEHAWFEDYRAFALALGGSGRRGELDRVRLGSGKSLYLGWVTGELRYLSA